MNLVRRVAKLENAVAAARPAKVVVTFEGPGSEDLPHPPASEIEEATMVVTVRFVAAGSGEFAGQTDV